MRLQGSGFFKAFVIALMWICFVSVSFAGVIDFENGTDGMPIASTIPGLEFTTTDGYDWIYGDWRTNNYNGPYPWGSYYSYGNFFAWLGTQQGQGVVTFSAAYATYFQIQYSSESNFYLEAYDESGNLLDSDFGYSNLDTGIMDTVRVEAPGMKYVMMHDTGNYWLVDNLDTDAITECLKDSDCDDQTFCNGIETCNNYLCVDGEAPDCSDDGLYCNGTESCDETKDECVSSGDPCSDDGVFCNGDESCDEETDGCISSGDPCADDETCNEELGTCDGPPEEEPDLVPEEAEPLNVRGGSCGV